VERECWVGETRSIERRYFINSIAADAKQFAPAVRKKKRLKAAWNDDFRGKVLFA
jgi:hypothetical protein